MTLADNQIDETVAKRWVGEIERKFDDLETERGTYMARCKSIRGQIKELKDAADSAGVGRASLNLTLEERKLERKKQKLRDDVEDDVIELAEQLHKPIGDLVSLPLGAAAGKREDETGKTADGKVVDIQVAGRGKKKGAAAPSTAGPSGDALSSLISDDIPEEKDIRPPFLKDKDVAAAAANAAAIEAGIKPLN